MPQHSCCNEEAGRYISNNDGNEPQTVQANHLKQGINDI